MQIEEKKYDTNLFQMYLYMNQRLKFSKITTKILLIIVQLEFLILLGDLVIIKKNEGDDDSSTIKQIISFLAPNLLYQKNTLIYFLISFFVKVTLITNILCFISLLQNKLTFLHIKKIKSYFSFTCFINSILLPSFLINLTLSEIIDQDNYYTKNKALMMIINVFGLLGLVFLGGVHSIFKRGETFNKEDFLHTIDFYYYFKLFIFKITLTILLIIYNKQQSNVFFYINLFFCGVTVFYFYLIHIFRIIMENFQIDQFSCMLWGLHFCMFISVFFFAVFNEAINVLSFTLVLFILSIPMIQKFKSSQLILRKFECKTEYQLKEFIILELEYQSSIDVVKEVMLRGIYLNHYINCYEQFCFCKRKNIYNAKGYKDEKLAEKFKFRNYSLMEHAAMKKSKQQNISNEVSIFLIDFLQKKIKNYINATFLLEKLIQQEIKFFESYELLRTKNLLKQKFQVQGNEKFEDKNIEEFIYYEDTYYNLQSKTKSLLSEMNQFWSTLKENSVVNDTSLRQLFDIINTKNECKKIWKNLKRYFKFNQNLEFLFNIFQKEFFNKRLHLNIDDLYLKKKKETILVSTNYDGIFGESFYVYFFNPFSCVIQIDMSNSKPGLIKRTNINVKNLFKYSASELYGKNINILMPKNFRDQHQSMLKKIQKTGQLYYKDHDIKGIALNKFSEPFPLQLFYKSNLCSNMCLDMMAICFPHVDEEMFPFIVTDQYGYILAQSAFLTQFTNLSCTDIDKYNVNLMTISMDLLKFFELSKYKVQKANDNTSQLQEKEEQNKDFIDIEIETINRKILKEKEVKKYFKYFKKVKDDDEDLQQMEDSTFKIQNFLQFYQEKYIDDTDSSISKISSYLHIKKRFQSFVELLRRIYEQNKSFNSNPNKQWFRVQHVQKPLKHGQNQHYFFIKKIFKEHKNQKQIVLFKYNQSINEFVLESNKNSTLIADKDSKHNSFQYSSLNILKQENNIFYKSKGSLPKKKLPSIHTFQIILCAFFFILIVLELIILSGWYLNDISKFRNNYSTLKEIYGVVMSSSISYNNFLNSFYDYYQLDYETTLINQNNNIKELLYSNSLRSTLIQYFNDKQYEVSLNPDSVDVNVGYYYLLFSYIKNIYLMQVTPDDFVKDETLYDKFLFTYKINIFNNFDVVDAISQEIQDVKEKTSVLLQNLMRYVGIAFIICYIILCLYQIYRIFKDIETLTDSFGEIDKNLIKQIINYYNKLQEFLNDRYFIKKINVQQEIVESTHEVNVNNKLKNIITKKFNQQTQEQISFGYLHSQQLKIQLIFSVFLIVLAIVMIVKQFVSHQVIFNSIYQLQEVGDYILNDSWRIPSLIMNAKDYHLNNTSFEAMGDSYRSKMEQQSLDLGNFYDEKFTIGQKLQYYYSKPICRIPYIKDIFIENDVSECADFFSGLLSSNLITVKRLLNTNLHFIFTQQDPSIYNYTSYDIANYDQTQIFLSYLLNQIVTEWWDEYIIYLDSYRVNFIVIALIWAAFCLMIWLFIYQILMKKIHQEYKIFKNIYLHFVPQETLNKNKLIVVKLNRMNVLQNQQIIQSIQIKFELQNSFNLCSKNIQTFQLNLIQIMPVNLVCLSLSLEIFSLTDDLKIQKVHQKKYFLGKIGFKKLQIDLLKFLNL